ncbi:MAG: uL15 family ribosomal protein [Candidatus Woesearchaeota archaeon]|nr:uL15 family ribosomal protein [Candidatus Woesearchaeota archaeon]
MVVKHQKKSGKRSGTHGWGRNKHRNSGSRGGYGMAGTGKKADNKKPSIWATEYFGKHGFVCQTAKTINAITLRDVEDKLPAWMANKQAKEEAGTIVLNLKELGYDKLLGTGKITRKIKITIAKSTASAAEKIKKAGGELVNK